jgi:hypothetical protein
MAITWYLIHCHQTADTVIIFDPDFNPHQVRDSAISCVARLTYTVQDLQVSAMSMSEYVIDSLFRRP